MRWAIGLGVFALVSYTFTNWLVERHSRVAPIPSLYFGWERRLPFVAWMIVPYWSIDPLFFLGPLLCTSRAELLAHAKRIVAAIIVACACFIFWPLKEAFVRPAGGGITGRLFQLLEFFDRPFNMAPSLHITEVVLLWALYSRHTRGPLRRLLEGWFLLIVASTVLTFQHHTVDVLTGWLLGLACVRLFPMPPKGRDTPVPGALLPNKEVCDESE